MIHVIRMSKLNSVDQNSKLYIYSAEENHITTNIIKPHSAIQSTKDAYKVSRQIAQKNNNPSHSPK